MPKKVAAAKKPTQVEEEDELEGAPLFDSAADIAYIAVIREDPEEGFLGKLPPRATEADIRKRYGGGTFTLQARNQGGKHIKGGHASVTIAGDPIFSSPAAERRWKRAQGILEEPAQRPAGDKPLGILELMMLLDKQGEKARLEQREFAASREREAQLAHERQLELLRADAGRRELELKAERERLEADSREREARREREAKEERERNRDHMQTMLQIATAKRSGDGAGLEALLKGIELAREMGGGDGEERDPAMLILQNLPAIIEHLKGASPAAALPALPPAAAAPGKRGRAAPVAETPRNGVPRVTLQGPLAAKVDQVARHLQAMGVDPAKAFEQLLDGMLGQGQGAQAPAAPPAEGAPAPAPRRSSSGGRKKPAARKSATR